ncbi:MAG TPA: tRNA-dihydrouridine synthase [Candidatus Paceibacterota bacterium]
MNSNILQNYRMIKNFWGKLERPILALAPMADVTDSVFRGLVAELGRPSVMFTEFVAADGLAHPVGRKRLLVDLKYSEIERPIVAQIWGGCPENIKIAARLVQDLGFDGLDINMGCPDKGVEKQKGGAYLIQDLDLTKQVIEAALESAPDLPLSIKTRLGYNSIELDSWIGELLKLPIVALTVHLRTRKEMSKVPAHWELASRLRDLVPNFSSSPSLRGLRRGENFGQIPSLLANGDIENLDDAREKVNKNNLDGVMLGRAIFGNPWLFGNGKPDWPEVFKIMIEHSRRFEVEYRGIKSFTIMRKFFGAYVAGYPRASDLKSALMLATNATDVEVALEAFK